MRYVIEKSAVPVLWLDTFAITQMAVAIYQKENNRPYSEELLKNFTDLVQLRIAKRIIIFESDQLLEIAVRPELVDISKRVMSQLSGSLVVRPWQVKEQQINCALRSFANKDKIRTLHWDDIYSEDPFKDRSVLGILIRCDIGTNARLEQKRKMAAVAYDNWQKIRAQYSGTTKNNFSKQYGLEKLSGIRLAQDVILAMKSTSPNKPYPLYYELIEKPGLYLKSALPDLDDFESAMVDFYESDYYTDLPMNDISFTLFAEKLCGNEDLKESDQADIENIASFLPYANYMVIDKAMADKVSKHKLDRKYGTRIIRMRDLGTIIAAIKSGDNIL